jgi:hypothetical protein
MKITIYKLKITRISGEIETRTVAAKNLLDYLKNSDIFMGDKVEVLSEIK